MTVLPLTDHDIEFLTKNTTYSDQEIRQWYRGFQSDCPDGKLSKDKLIDIYRGFFKGGKPEKFCEQVYRTFDADGNGWVDFKELLVAIAITTGTKARQKLDWVFKMYDINNDGVIKLEELTKIISALHEMLGDGVSAQESAKRAKEAFDRMDTKNEGKVTFDEFVRICDVDQQLAHLLLISDNA